MDSLDRLAAVFCEIDDIASMKRFLAEIFTPAEIDDFVLRWRLMELLHKGLTQREISSRLGISLCKITRGSKVLKTRDSVTAEMLKDKIGDT